MSAAFDKAFDVFLKVQADADELKKLNDQLGETKRKIDDVGESSKQAASASTALAAGIGAVIGTIAANLGRAAINEIGQAIEEASKATARWKEEVKSLTEEVEKQSEKWTNLAQSGFRVKDAARLSETIAADLANVSAMYDNFRAEQITGWQKFTDIVANMLNAMQGGAGWHPAAEDLASKQKQALEEMSLSNEHANAAIDSLKENTADWARILAGPTASGIEEVKSKIADLNAQSAELDKKRYAPPGGTARQIEDANIVLRQYGDVNQELSLWQGHLDTLTREQEKLNKAGDRAGAHEAHQIFIADLREEQLHLTAIRGLMAAVEADPFATVAQKSAAQFNLISASLKVINADIAHQKALMQDSALDPVQLEQVKQKLLQDNLEMIKLTHAAQALSGGGQLRADLIQWANQFGTTVHQIGGLITDTLGGAINGLSSGISGVIFRTQTLGQAALQMGEQFVSSLIRVGLQMITQAILGKALARSAEAEQIASGLAIALGMAPAAAMSSIATSGSSAVIGGAAAVAAFSSIIGLISGFEKGGYTGDTLGIVHPREYVMDAKTVARAGGPSSMDNLRVAINRTVRGGGSGPAGAGRGGDGTHFYFFTDRTALQNHWQSNPASKKSVIDWVNQSGGHLRT